MVVQRAFGRPYFRLASILPMLSCLFFLSVQGDADADTLNLAIEQKVRAATFEVVIPKPVDDPVIYEKPLPLDLLPYQFRIDKYYSIGTAFALAPHQFATAAHVLNATIGSQLGTPALRDNSGHVFAIKQILKYSSAEDFVVFSLAEEPSVEPLEIGAMPAINDTVYAVGNALGNGVVIRDGLYTSDTPEEIDGRWKWLRFSAAASPGNSGGPLLDKSGKVIGIVRAKSPNENLNYALPIAQIVQAKENTAVLDAKVRYQLDIFDEKQPGRLNESFALPKDFTDFCSTYQKIWYDFTDRLLTDLLHENAASIFPQGEQSSQLLHSIETKTFPQLIMKGDDGNWNAFEPETISGADLPNNGHLSYGNLRNNTLLHLHRPNNLAAAGFYGDSKSYMDMALKGIVVSRKVGTESIRVVSLGKATQDSIFPDAYGRKWQLRVWPLTFKDSYLVSMALPVPDGYVAIVRVGSSGQLHGNIADMKVLTGFISAIYDGSFAQWQGFLSNTAILPAAFSTIAMDFDYGRSFRFKSRRFDVSFSSELQPVAENSDLMLNLTFFTDQGKTVWEVAGLEADEDRQSQTGFAIYRNMRPAATMNDSAKSWWDKIEHNRHPFDGVAYNDSDKMFIRRSITATEPGPAGKADFIYNTVYEVEGPAGQDVMKDKLDRVIKSLSISEN